MRATLPGSLRLLLLAALGLAGLLTFMAFTLALNGYQLTEREPARRLLERALAALTDVDTALPALQESLREEGQRAEGTTLTVPDFPVPVEVTREEALTLEGEGLRQVLLRRGAQALYRQGTSALLSDPDASRRLERTSMPWALEQGLGLITQDTHRRLLVAMIALGALSLALLLAPLLLTRPLWGKVAVLGGVLLVASLPPLAVAIGARFFLRAAQSDAEPFVYELLQVGIEAMTVPIRNYLTLSALGSGLLAVAAAMVWAESRTRAPALTGGEDAA